MQVSKARRKTPKDGRKTSFTSLSVRAKDVRKSGKTRKHGKKYESRMKHSVLAQLAYTHTDTRRPLYVGKDLSYMHCMRAMRGPDQGAGKISFLKKGLGF